MKIKNEGITTLFFKAVFVLLLRENHRLKTTGGFGQFYCNTQKQVHEYKISTAGAARIQ